MATLSLEYDRLAKKSTGLMLTDFDTADIPKLKEIEGFRWSSQIDGAWFPLNAAWALMYNLPGIELTPGCRQWFDWAEQKMGDKAAAEIDTDIVPETPEGVFEEYKLRPYQIESVAFAMRYKRVLWGMDTRLGKTFSALCVHLLSGSKRTLVVAPKNTIWNWNSEVEKFLEDAPNTVVVDGTRKKKLKMIDEFEEGLMITNYETVQNTMEWGKNGREKILIGGPLQEVDWDMIIVDEFHLIKNAESLRGKAVRSIRPEYILQMSGTPTPNGIHEIWSPLNYLNSSFFPNYYKFEATFCTYETRKVKTRAKRGEKNKTKNIKVLNGYKSRIRELHHLLRIYMRRYKFSDVANQIAEPIETPRFVDLNPTQKRLYNKIVSEGGYSYEKEVDGEKQEFFQTSPLAIGTRLKRICASAALVDDEAPIKSSKIDEIVDLVLAIDEPIVVMTQYPNMVDFIVDRLETEGVDTLYTKSDMTAEQRHEVNQDFEERGKGRVFVTTIGISQVGIKLARANTLIFADATFVPAEMLQASRRVFDPSKEDQITIYHIIARGTVEERIHRILEAKKAVISLLIDGEIPQEQIQSLMTEAIMAEVGEN